MIPVRYKAGDDRVGRTFAPLAEDNPFIGIPCIACDIDFQPGDQITLVYVGPGDDPDDQQKFRDGRFHSGAAAALHRACAGVDVE